MLLERRFSSTRAPAKKSHILLWLSAAALALSSVAALAFSTKARKSKGRELLAKTLDYLKKDLRRG